MADRPKWRIAILMANGRIALAIQFEEYDSARAARRAAKRERAITPFINYIVVKVEPL